MHPSVHIVTTINYLFYHVIVYVSPLIVQALSPSLRPTQLPLMCAELATSPSGVSMMVWRMYRAWCGLLGMG